MKHNMIRLNKRYLIIILFFFVLLSNTVFLSQAQSPDMKYNFDCQWVKLSYDRGRQAYENNDWCYAVENLFLYYQLNGSHGVFNNNPEFMKELTDALQYAEKQIKTALNENISLKWELKQLKSKGAGKKYQAVTIPNKPNLRRIPPTK